MTRASVALLVVLGIGALLVPFALRAAGLEYYQGLASRIVVYGIAATSLNLIMGYGGMVSFGHAAFVGLGAYATAILITEGQQSAVIHLAVTVGVTIIAGLVIGSISLRTRGVHFIMITLAFAQMLYFLSNSIKGYGGDEGLTIRPRSLIGIDPWRLDLKNPLTLYYVALFVLVVTSWLLGRFLSSRMGHAIVAQRDDDVRAEGLGFPVYRLKLALFVAAAVLAGVAGALLVNLQGYVSPNLLHWTQSGTLMVMVILGGVASRWGGLLGATVLLLLEEILSSYTDHGEFWTGWVLLGVVLFTRHGLAGLAGPGALRLKRRPT